MNTDESQEAEQGELRTLVGPAIREAQRSRLVHNRDDSGLAPWERLVRHLTALSFTPDEVDPDTSLLLARGWESLAELAPPSRRTAPLLAAATQFELAGYQANAACLAAEIRALSSRVEAEFEEFVARFLERRLVAVSLDRAAWANEPSAEEGYDRDAFQSYAGRAIAHRALRDAARFFLRGDVASLDLALTNLALSWDALAEVGDAPAANAVHAVRKTLPTMQRHSTWSYLGGKSPSPRWARYLRALSRGLGPADSSRSISELWPSQRAAIDHELLDNRNSVVLRMPTSAGKTRVAEMVMVHGLIETPGSKAIYIAPYRALASEIEASLAMLLEDLGYSAAAIAGGFDDDLAAESAGASYDVLVLTPEKLDRLLRLRAEILDSVGTIVVDEAHIVGDLERGPKFELLISRLRRRLPSARFVVMSAVVPDSTLTDFVHWLGDSEDGEGVSSAWRPTLLRHFELRWENDAGKLIPLSTETELHPDDVIEDVIQTRVYEHIFPATQRRRRPSFPGASKGQVAAEIAYRLAPQGPVLVYAMQPNWAVSTADALLERLSLMRLTGEEVPGRFQSHPASRSLAVAHEWLGESHGLTRLLEQGIAYHHGRLPGPLRRAIEHDFREKRLSVLCATGTLAQGVNLPVRSVVFHSVQSREQDGTTRVLPARDYWNIAGRAGRAGAETEGIVVHVTLTPYDRADVRKYVRTRDRVEQVESALHRMLRDLVQDRVSTTEVARRLDPDILALLVEEVEVEITEPVLRDLLGDSLFMIQALEREEDPSPLIRVIANAARAIAERVPDVDTRAVYASTGLATTSCLELADHIAANAELLAGLATGASDPLEMLDVILDGLARIPEMEPRYPLSTQLIDVIGPWVGAVPVGDIADDLSTVDTPERVLDFVEDSLSYRLPWGLSAYLAIMRRDLDIQDESALSVSLPGILRHGVPTPEAAWAMSLGVATRSSAVRVAAAFMSARREISPVSFRRWLGRLDPHQVNDVWDIEGFELEAVASAILRARPNEHLAKLSFGKDLVPLLARCRIGTAALATGAAFQARVGGSVELVRDYDSAIDRNATTVRLPSGVELGYLDSDAARAVALEIDTGREFTAVLEDLDLQRRSASVRIDGA